MEKKFQKWILEDERGKRPGQKFKSLLVMWYILENTNPAQHQIGLCRFLFCNVPLGTPSI